MNNQKKAIRAKLPIRASILDERPKRALESPLPPPPLGLTAGKVWKVAKPLGKREVLVVTGLQLLAYPHP